MKILFLTTYYDPEIVAGSNISNNIREAMIMNNHELKLITPIPSRGISKEVRNLYRTKKIEEKYNGKLKIKRYWLPKEGKNPFNRGLRYLLSSIFQLYNGLKTKDIELVYAGSTPPLQGVVASIIKKIRRVPMIYNLQDIFPDSLANAGLTKKNSFIYKLGAILEKFIYKNADKIIVISKDFEKNLIAKGVPKEKIEVIYNWVDADIIKPVKKTENKLFEELGLDNTKFYITYAGNLGYAQNIEIILNVAKELKEYSNIKFIIFGNGAQEVHYKNMAMSIGINNIYFYDLQPFDRVSEVYSLGDISIVSCKLGSGGSAMPSKTWSIMSSGTAVLANFDKDTDLQNIIEESKAGIFTTAEDLLSLKEAILKLYNNKDLCMKLGLNGREFILKNLTKNVGTQKYIEILDNLGGDFFVRK